MDLYGEDLEKDFKYESKDGQYNVVLKSGESVVLSKPYIDSL